MITDALEVLEFQRESSAHLDVEVKVDGVIVTTGHGLAISYKTARPTSWAAPVIVDGKPGVMLSGLASRLWRVWARQVLAGGGHGVAHVIGKFRIR